MNLLRRLSVRTRLLLAALLAGGLLAVLGAVGLWSLSRLADLDDRFARQTYGSTVSLMSLRLAIGNIRQTEKDILIAYEKTEAVTALRRRWTDAVLRARRDAGELAAQPGNPHAAALTQVYQLLVTYGERATPVMNQIQAGGYDTSFGADRVLSRAKELMRTAEDQIDDMLARLAADAQQAHLDRAAATWAIQATFIASVLLAIVVLLPLTLIHGRSLYAPLARMLAALSATNEAIMRAVSPEQLYQQVCRAAVDGGGFITTAILLPDEQTRDALIVAVAGPYEHHLRQVRISVDPGTPQGRGLVGTAFATQRPCISNQFLSDERTRPWHAQARQAGIASGAAVPLVRDGRTCGILLFYANQKHEFDDQVVKLLERMAANVVFALDNMEHEAERRRSRERIDYLASHDGLTGLPNRVMFSELLNLAIATARRYQRRFAVMFLDLDRFKLINDSLGHEAGDQLLREMSARLTGCLRDSDVVARLGGDEFVVLVQELGEPEQVAAVARKILAAAMKPFTLLGQECRVTASIGISIYPDHAQDEPALMKHADMAMYCAKEEGKNNFQFYSSDVAALSLERLALETNLRRALERNEFTLHYQAKKEVHSGRISGVEALLRWHSAELGPIPPARLIPVAEETGLIVPIGKWVLRTACAQHMAWRRDGLPPVCMAVNLSARQFSDPFLLHDIEQVLRDTGMEPHLLELEITEGMVIQHPDKAIKVLTAIKALGVRLAIDDFGTGYSSLGQLKHFPIDTLKVDRSFIRDVAEDGEDRAITEAIIAMGKTLNLTVVAEGVETTDQETFLRQHACDQLQGYLISKPVPAEQFAQWLSGAQAPASTPAETPPAAAGAQGPRQAPATDPAEPTRPFNVLPFLDCNRNPC